MPAVSGIGERFDVAPHLPMKEVSAGRHFSHFLALKISQMNLQQFRRANRPCYMTDPARSICLNYYDRDQVINTCRQRDNPSPSDSILITCSLWRIRWDFGIDREYWLG
jgi:hypothetical protein